MQPLSPSVKDQNMQLNEVVNFYLIKSVPYGIPIDSTNCIGYDDDAREYKLLYAYKECLLSMAISHNTGVRGTVLI